MNFNSLYSFFEAKREQQIKPYGEKKTRYLHAIFLAINLASKSDSSKQDTNVSIEKGCHF